MLDQIARWLSTSLGTPKPSNVPAKDYYADFTIVHLLKPLQISNVIYQAGRRLPLPQDYADYLVEEGFADYIGVVPVRT